MIIYTISPNNAPVYSGSQKLILPTLKQFFFFATSDEYLNISNLYVGKQLFNLGIDANTNPILVRANTVVEYECGITLNNKNEINALLSSLKIQNKGHPKKHEYYDDRANRVKLDYESEYHLEHNYNNALLETEEEQVLLDHGFPKTISHNRKDFVLSSIGADLCEDKIDKSTSNPSNIKGRHIQIIYKNFENDGFLKFKKPDNPTSQSKVSEISQFSEHDAIYVNIHIVKKSPDQNIINFDDQLHEIGQTFNYVVTNNGAVTQNFGCPPETTDPHFNALQRQFGDLINHTIPNYPTCRNLHDESLQNFPGCTIKVGQITIQGIQYLRGGASNIITNVKNIDFDNKISKDFLSLDIYHNKLLAPSNLNEILNGTNISPVYTLPPAATSESESEDKQDRDAPAPINEEANDIISQIINPMTGMSLSNDVLPGGAVNDNSDDSDSTASS